MSEKSSKSPVYGLFVLIGKVGGKLVKVFPKLLKALKIGKTGMAAGSFAAYAVLFSWEFALVLMGSLFVHEMGHIWAMKREGMKTKGVYFIPLLGAAAVGEGDFPTRKSEVRIALMGPLWGFGLALLTFIAYLLTDLALFAALAGWMAMLNAFNLLPINPLDGGRVMKSVAYSISNRAGLWFMVIGLAGAFALAWVFNLGLITFLIIIGAMELLGEVQAMRRDDDRRKVMAALAETLRCENDPEAVEARIAETYRAIDAGSPAADLDLALPGLAEYPDDEMLTAAERDRWSPEWKERDPRGKEGCSPAEFGSWRHRRFSHAIERVAVNAVRSRRHLIRFWRRSPATPFYRLAGSVRGQDLRDFLRDAPKPIMTPRETILVFGAYLALGLALFALMYAASHVPAAGAALHVFIG